MFRLEEVVLNIKSLNVLNNLKLEYVMSQLVEPPLRTSVYDAVELLEQIGALDKNVLNIKSLNVLGFLYSHFPWFPMLS